MELEIGSGSTLESTSQSSLEIQGGVASSPPPQYFIVKDGPKRDVRPPQRFGETDLVAYALSVAEGIDSGEEPFTYLEIVSCDDSCRWMIAM